MEKLVLYPFLKSQYWDFLWINALVIRQKGESENGCYKKTKHVKFSEKRKFFTQWYAHVYVCIRSKKCSFFGKFGVLCFLETPVLKFALLPYYRRKIWNFVFFCMLRWRTTKTILKLRCWPLAFTWYKNFLWNKNSSRASLPASFSAWFFKKKISHVKFS